VGATEALVELQKLRETAESLRRIGARLPAELRSEIDRVARQIEDDAETLEAKIKPSD
jgi:chaperonin cofactor prefoldin